MASGEEHQGHSVGEADGSGPARPHPPRLWQLQTEAQKALWFPKDINVYIHFGV